MSRPTTLQDDYGRLHATHVAALVRHLIECRRACGGDLDLFLVLTIIGNAASPHVTLRRSAMKNGRACR
jgi:hypothetical protein